MASSGSTSFEEIDWNRQEQEDELNFQKLLNTEPGGEPLIDLDRPLDAGEKADDAEDFEDISDDDLPDEEPATGGDKDDDAPGLTDDVDMGDDDDDLFRRGSRYITFRRARWP